MTKTEEDSFSIFQSAQSLENFQGNDLAYVRKLATEVQRALERLPDSMGSLSGTQPLICAKRLEKERRQRSKFFSEHFVWDPAWPMLVELFRCRAEGVELSVTSLAISVDVPAATGRRWIDDFSENGLIERWHSKDDARRTLVKMSDSAFEHMKGYLVSIC